MINGIIIVALIVVAIFAVKGSIRQFTYGCCGTKDVEKKIKVLQTIRTTQSSEWTA